MNEAVRRCFERRKIGGRDRLLAAVSGGPDSMALLRAAEKLLPEFGYTLAAAHVNHGIRGRAADEDEELVRRYCAEHGIPFYLRRADVPALARCSHTGIEEAARRVRYDFFDELCREHGFTHVLTAHQAEDNLETVILGLTRGGGLAAAAGIPEVRGKMLRPLLSVRRSETVQYCIDEGIAFAVDETNADVDYARNRVRHCVTPELLKLNPRACEAFGRFAAMAAEDEAYLSGIAERELAAMTAADGSIDAEKLASLPFPIAGRALHRAFAAAGGGTLPYAQANAVLTLCGRAAEKAAPGKLSLVNGMEAGYAYGRLRFAKQQTGRSPDEIVFDIPLHRGRNDIPAAAASVFVDDGNANIYNKLIKALRPCDKIYSVLLSEGDLRPDADAAGSGLGARSRRPGDTMFYTNGRHREIRRALINEKIPADLRRRLPVIYICGSGKIIWAAGLALHPPQHAAVRVSVVLWGDCRGQENQEEERGD